MSAAPGIDKAPATSQRRLLKVLVIEDDDAIAKLTTMIIEKSGPYSVERANSIASAQERFRQDDVDAALLDLPDLPVTLPRLARIPTRVQVEKWV